MLRQALLFSVLFSLLLLFGCPELMGEAAPEDSAEGEQEPKIKYSVTASDIVENNGPEPPSPEPPPQAEPEEPPPASFEYTATAIDSKTGKTYDERATYNSSGITLAFGPPIERSENEYPPGYPYYTYSHHLLIDINGTPWAAVEFDEDELAFAREKQYGKVGPPVCTQLPEEERMFFEVSGKRYVMEELEQTGSTLSARLCEAMENRTCINGTQFKINPGESLQMGDEYLHAWETVPGYVFCGKYARLSVFHEIADFGAGGAQATWVNQNGIPSLQQIFIPYGSPLYEQLT